MKALILVGGFGTRLRPLTFSKPKPLVEFANRPMIMHQIAALAKVGVTEIILAVNYQPDVMLTAMKKVEEEFGVKVSFSIEEEPLGTAGPLALAAESLAADGDAFFVLNSDVICEFPFEEMIQFHKSHGGDGTLMVTPVEDPSKYGVIVKKAGSSAVERFVEKPKTWVGDEINAGIYILNPCVLDRIELRPMSIEKEVFPHMARDGTLHVMNLKGFWADVGQPKDFLAGLSLYLRSLVKHPSGFADQQLAKQEDYKSIDVIIKGSVLIAPDAKIGRGSKIGPNVVVGAGVVVGEGVRLVDCVLMAKSDVKDNAYVQDSIVGWYSSVGKWARLMGIAVLGEDVHIADEVMCNGGSILPHKSVTKNIMTPEIVM